MTKVVISTKQEDNPNNYLRIGTQYYKIVYFPLLSGDTIKKLIPWNVETIIRDNGRAFLEKIKKYDSFCYIPNHIDYKEVINGHLNRYEKITHEPKKGNWNTIREFLVHIFKEQIEIGLDYFAITYLKPRERLPLLALFSRERSTGKSTALALVKAIYQNNAVFSTNEDMRTQFNSHLAGKIFNMIDETLLEKREDSERLKFLVTARNYNVEAKGIDKQEVEYFTKFIMCSNNPNFIYVEPNETRYWVRKISPFEKENTNLLEEMKIEIPAFLYFLKERGIKTPKMSRLWFDFKLYETDELKKLIRANRNRLEMQMANIVVEIMDCFDLEEYSFCIKDLQNNLNRTNKGSFDHSSIIRVLKDEWKLAPNKITSTYTTYLYSSDGFLAMITNNKGRFYTIERNWMKQNFDDLMI